MTHTPLDRKPRLWLFSNRQPWTEAVVQGLIQTKTRNQFYMKPNDLVLLHASTQMWKGWGHLPWCWNNRVEDFERGGVCGIAHVQSVGHTAITMPEQDRQFFVLDNGFNCAMTQSVVFDDVIRIPLIVCNGAQRERTKFDPFITDILANYPPAVEFLSKYHFNLSVSEKE